MLSLLEGDDFNIVMWLKISRQKMSGFGAKKQTQTWPKELEKQTLCTYNQDN